MFKGQAFGSGSQNDASNLSRELCLEESQNVKNRRSACKTDPRVFWNSLMPELTLISLFTNIIYGEF